ncbi:cytochrome c nitrite reductase pentaheme subunit [Pasteurellaceae bacterium LIM206]|nr:cytochrome c nitrite reductase pentaheme subunit [Pasteurellaceae bacterium LIM206]
MLKLSALLGAMVFAIPSLVHAEESKPEQPSATASYEPQLENDRNPNEYCAKCHSLDTSADQATGDNHAGKFHGTHLSKTNPATGKPITCVSCHGNISENHLRGVKDVMRFHGMWDNNEPIQYSVEEQNQVCYSCHKPEDLRAKLWAHDVHAMKLSCASCHTLHPAQDKMKDIQPKQRVKLCVDCHGKQREEKEAREKLSATEQKDKQ